MNSPTTPLILAIDLGTSGPKVALVNLEGQVVDCVFEPIELTLLADGGAEQDPQEWWDAIVRACRHLFTRGPGALAKIVAVSCTAQWSGTVAVDRAGDPLGAAVIWMDSRGAKYMDPIVGGFLRLDGYGAGKLYRWLRATGGIPGRAGKDPIAHIHFLRNERPEIYGAAYKFLEPKDYLNLKLTGRFLATYDSITLHWITNNQNPLNIVYDERLLRVGGLDRDKLPDLVSATSIVGKVRPDVAKELGISAEAQVVGGTPDIFSAAIGSGAVRDDEPHLYLGTSSWIACHVPYKKCDVFHNIASLPSPIPGRYLVTNEQQTAGVCLDLLRDTFLPVDHQPDSEIHRSSAYRELDRLASESQPGSGGLIFTPWLYGERTPIGDPHVRGGFYNLSLHTKREGLVRAVFEGVAYNSRWLLEYVERFIGKPIEEIPMIGGGANSPVWRQIYADVLGRRIRQIENPIEVNVRGAGLLGLVALGYLKFEEIPDKVRTVSVNEPDRHATAVYNRLFAEFKRIYKNNRGMYTRLNDPAKR